MAEMMMLIDTSRCTGCRGCQVACKQWHGLPGVSTSFTGAYQNPPDFDGDTYGLVRFTEHEAGPCRTTLLMTHDKCRHCDEPACAEELPPDRWRRHPSGAVVFAAEAHADLDDVRDACPFAVPGRDERTGAIVKCKLCVDRTTDGLLPACVQTCPTGALTWGERGAMMQQARERCAWITRQDRFAGAKVRLYPDELFSTHVRWILLDTPERHGLHADV
jgi:formate dehydrogenase iron-sulfur subunit